MVFKSQDAWRSHPVFTNLWRSAFPGFKYAAVAFGVYCFGEFAYDKMTAPKPAHEDATKAAAASASH